MCGDKGKSKGSILLTANDNGNHNDEGDDESDRDVLSFSFVSNLMVSQVLLNFVLHRMQNRVHALR